MIYRVKKEARFTVIDNQLATDSRLSFGARGLLVYLLSKPDNWEVRMSDLINASPAGRTAVTRMVKELEDAGYMRRVQERSTDGTFGQGHTEVYESPQSGFLHTDNLKSENQPLINTEEEINTELTKDLIPPKPPKGGKGLDIPPNLDTQQFREVWEAWECHRAEIKKPLKPTMKQRQLKQLSDWGITRAIAALEHTMFKGWQGIREPDQPAYTNGAAPPRVFKTKDEIRRENNARAVQEAMNMLNQQEAYHGE